MSLIQSAKLNEHDRTHAYLKGVLQRLPTHKNNQIAELLQCHRWHPAPS
jgi:transposase